MPDTFPMVGVIGEGNLARMMMAPATALGVGLIHIAPTENNSVKQFAARCTVVTIDDGVPISMIRSLEAEGFVLRAGSSAFLLRNEKNDSFSHIHHSLGAEISVIVARSPHAQASAWTPTLVVRRNGIFVSTETPALVINQRIALQAQKQALMISQEIGAVGVMAVEMLVHGDDLRVKKLAMGPHISGNWTIEGSRTSQYEQHLRAVLDLPLGDPTMTSSHAVTGNIYSGIKNDMYRPYLHLMARSPALKIHQYRQDVRKSHPIGHVTAVGDDLLDLQESVSHAVDYMSGVIDE
jgi:phosphoribosylaminoimidazole carboxylase (NCAIR synthetase)